MADFYELALARIIRISIAAGALGSIVALLTHGSRAATGFLVGAIISLLNFRWWMGLAGALGDSGKAPLRASAAFMTLRYVLAALVIYAIVKVLEITLAAVLSGLFVSVAAIIIEILYELIIIR